MTVQGEEQTYEKVTAAMDRRAPSGRPENLTGHSFDTSVQTTLGKWLHLLGLYIVGCGIRGEKTCRRNTAWIKSP